MVMLPLSHATASSTTPTTQRGATVTTASTTQTTTIRPHSTRLQQPVLRLRGAMRSPGERSDRRIQWADDVIDNEGLGRKSSKGIPLPPFSSLFAFQSRLYMYSRAWTRLNDVTVCCIYHAPKASIDDSSDDSSSDSLSSDSDSDDGSARPVSGKRRANARRHKHSHDQDSGGDCHDGSGRTKKSRRSGSPNAYQKMPKPKDSGPA